MQVVHFWALGIILGTAHRIDISRRATQQCNMSPYFYAIDWPE